MDGLSKFGDFALNCNSDAPEIYDCSVCSELPRGFPPNFFVKRERWKLFKKTIYGS